MRHDEMQRYAVVAVIVSSCYDYSAGINFPVGTSVGRRRN